MFSLKEKGDKIRPRDGQKASGKSGMSIRALVNPAIILIAASLMFLNPTEAQADCEVITIINTSNKTNVCDDPFCNKEGHPYKVKKGHVICLVNLQGETTRLQVTDIILRVRYELAYYTTDYDTTLKHACACCKDGEEEKCKRGGVCNERAQNSFFETYPVAMRTRAFSQCFRGAQDGFYIYCHFHSNSTRKGALFPVLRKVREVGKVKLTVQKEDNFSKTILQEDDYNFDLSSLNVAVSLIVLNASSGTSPNRSLLQYEDEFYYVDSAEIKSPTKDMFGDYQVALNKIDEIYDFRPCPRCVPVHCSENVTSSTNNCYIEGSSQMSSFPGRKRALEQPSNFITKKTGLLVVEAVENHNDTEAFILVETWNGKAEKIKSEW